MLRRVRGPRFGGERSRSAIGFAPLGLALLVALEPTPRSAHAQGQPEASPPPSPAARPGPPSGTADDETRALALASYAFEYRDFARVITTLDPWVHPPRIADRARLAEAQRLLGVSLHVQGDVARAAEEFAAVLQFDPELRLDPFIIPPAVIDTFERVRASMRPVLDRILADRKKAQVRPPVVAAPLPPAATALPPLFAYAPLGLSHFLALDEPGWGALFLGLQVIGLGTNAVGWNLAHRLEDDSGYVADTAAHDQAVVFQMSGIALFAAAWLASGIHAHAHWPDPPSPGLPVNPP